MVGTLFMSIEVDNSRTMRIDAMIYENEQYVNVVASGT